MADGSEAADSDGHPGLSLALARTLHALAPADLTAADHRQLSALILDHVACGLRGAALPWGRKFQAWAAPYLGRGPAPLYLGAGARAPAFVAALANGAAAHGMELDDTHDESVCHPGAVVISAALAVGAETGATGGELLAAIVVGYEAMARTGQATGGGEMLARGFHPTAVFGAFGAAAAAAKLRRLPPEGWLDAWGLALSLTGGSTQFSQESVGTTVKRLHAGFAAQNGVLAVELAAQGVEGPRSPLDGRYGAARLFGPNPDLARLTEPSPMREIHRISFKPYPCCRLFHSTLDALEEVTGGYATPTGEIAALAVGGPAIILHQHMLRRPGSTMAAQYQLPHTLAAALLHGPRAERGFEAEARADPRLHALEDRVSASFDPEYEAAFPAHFGSSVRLTLASGEVREARVMDSLGTPARPMTPDALAAKADGLLDAAGARIRSADLLPAIEALPEAASLAPLLELLAHG